jgi:chromosome partitioning protein
MLHEAPIAMQKAPHVIVVGNEKGGSGKTTIAMHVAVGLLKDGQRVSGQIIEELSSKYPSIAALRALKVRGWKRTRPRRLAAFEAAVSNFDQSLDFLVIDTPANDNYLMRLAHLVADTLLTPLNDSFLDFGTLASIDPVTHEVTERGHYAGMVCEAGRQRRLFDRSHISWLVIRNRLSLDRLGDRSLDKLAMSLVFRPLDGCADRIVYRQLFRSGLTAFDSLDEATLEDRPSRGDELLRSSADGRLSNPARDFAVWRYRRGRAEHGDLSDHRYLDAPL